MLITVLISTTRGRAQSLRFTLESLFQPHNVAARDWELLLITDQTCEDEVVQLCHRYQEMFPAHFRFLVQKGRGKSLGMNEGIAAARGEVLAMTDDDVICAPDYLEGIRTVFRQPGIDGAQGRVLLDCEGGRPPYLDDVLARFMGERNLGDEMLDWNDNLNGTNMVVRAEPSRRVGGFTPALGAGAIGFAEDSEFSLRLRKSGYRFVYAPPISVRHCLPRNRLTKSFLRGRFFRSGRSIAYLDPLQAPWWRFGAYVVKNGLLKYAQAARHRLAGRPGKALLRQCEAWQEAGFFWQHLLFKWERADSRSETASREPIDRCADSSAATEKAESTRQSGFGAR